MLFLLFSLTHKNNEPKKNITVTWTKPDDYTSEHRQDLYLKYTIVSEKMRHWVGLEYPIRETETPKLNSLGFRTE